MPALVSFRPRGVTARCTAPSASSVTTARQRHDDRRREAPVVAVGVDVDDRVAERDHPGERGDRRRGDHVDRRDADAAEDQRQRQRQLHAPHDLGPRHAHAARGVDRVAVDLAHARVGVGQDRRDREQHQRQRQVREAHAEIGDEERDQREARHRAADVGDVDREEAALADVAEPEPERDRRSRTRSPSRRTTASGAPRSGPRSRRARRPARRRRGDSRSLKMKSIASPNWPRNA